MGARIARKVAEREMPPWFADEPKGVFSNERGLTERRDPDDRRVGQRRSACRGSSRRRRQRRRSRAAKRAAATRSASPTSSSRWTQPYFVSDEAEDVQGTFHTKLTDEMLPRDVVVRAWEFRAGTYMAGRDTVHHMCGGVRPPGFVANPADDAEGEGAAGLSLGCIAGGAEAQRLPPDFGMELTKGSTITMNMHYYKQPGTGTGLLEPGRDRLLFRRQARSSTRCAASRSGRQASRFRRTR